MEGIKHDKDKPLIADFIRDFKEPLLELCKIYEFGRNKYGLGNWQQLENGQERFDNALMRHFLKEGLDDETNVSHVAHVAFNALMVLWYDLHK